MEIHFFGGCSCPGIFIESIDDIDFADSLAFLNDLEMIHIYLKKGKKWSKPKAKLTVDKIISDLKFDGYDPSLKYEIEGSLLNIEGEFK